MDFKTYIQESVENKEDDLIELLVNLHRVNNSIKQLDKFFDMKGMMKTNKMVIAELEKIYKQTFPDRNLKNKLMGV